MSTITDKLQQQKTSARTGLIIYLTAGYPDLDTTLKAVLAAAAAGADVVEIGIPFSDPIADGPVIQKAAAEALKGGVTTAKILAMIQELRRFTKIPLAVMTYANTIVNYGAAEFIHDFGLAGINGIIVPDLPLEEMDLLQEFCKQSEIDLIQFIAPTTSAKRIEAICNQAGGFIYCISSTGVTGVRAVDYEPVKAAVDAARLYTSVPIAIGFGIGSPEAAKEAAKYADAVIVGSAVITKLETAGVSGVGDLVKSIRSELDKESG